MFRHQIYDIQKKLNTRGTNLKTGGTIGTNIAQIIHKIPGTEIDKMIPGSYKRSSFQIAFFFF